MNKQDNEKNPIEGLMSEAMSRLKSVIDVNTVIGNPITTTEGNTIIPISKVSAGFIVGGGEYSQSQNLRKLPEEFPFAGGTGSGFNITPIGFLVESSNGIKLINVDNKSAYENLLEIFKNVTEKIAK